MSDEAPRGYSGAGPTPLLMRAAELLDDLGWHEREAIVRDLARLVPPGRAMRATELSRKSAPNAPAVRKQNVDSHERQIRSGQRQIARQTLNGSNFRAETRLGPDGEPAIWVRMVRLPPSVHAERSRRRAHRIFSPDRLVDELFGGADAKALLSELTYNQLFGVALELVERNMMVDEADRGVDVE